jgi:hypothetical protein
MSVPAGNALQIGGLVAGAVLLAVAARLRESGALSVVLMIVGFLAIYVCCHAIAHWFIGRLAGIRFRGYGLRGTDHPETYPPVFRQILSVAPFFTAMTDRESMRRAGPAAKALMFAAGETSSSLFSLLAGAYAWRSGIPRGFALFAIAVIFSAVATVMTAITPRGDYTKARRALRAFSQRSIGLN